MNKTTLNKTTLLLGSIFIPFFIGCEGITGDDDGNQIVHNQGINCLQCHSSGEHSFNSGATIYTILDGENYDSTKVANGSRVRLVLDTGATLTYVQGNGYGNVLWRGDVGAINNFTAEILDSTGKVVNSSRTNSHNVGRLACNACHTKNGLNGAPGRIVNYNFYGTLVSKIQTK